MQIICFQLLLNKQSISGIKNIIATTLFMLFFCVSTLFSHVQASSFEDFKTPIRTAMEAQDSKSVESSIVEIWRLTDSYLTKNYPFLEMLAKQAQTNPQHEFVKAYRIFLRATLVRVLAGAYKKSPYPNKAHLALLETFLDEQERFIASFGGDIFEFLEYFKVPRFCRGASCGHINELFILASMLNEGKKITEREKEIAEYGRQGALFYTFFDSDVMYEGFKLLGVVQVNRPFSQEMESLIQELEAIDEGGDMLQALVGYFGYTYLQQLYRAKYLLAMSQEPRKTKEILQDVRDSDMGFCLDSTYFNKEAQKECEIMASELQGVLESLAASDRIFLLQDKQNCVKLALSEQNEGSKKESVKLGSTEEENIKQDDATKILKPIATFSISNKSPLCLATQNKLKSFCTRILTQCKLMIQV